jgi:DnaJ-class molecular chaperone
MSTLRPITRRQWFATAMVTLVSAGIAVAAVCQTCQGSGTSSVPCSLCKGTGLHNQMKCPLCKGKGFQSCAVCGGSGKN